MGYGYSEGPESGPQAFRHIRMFNQKHWDENPERAAKAALEAVMSGGFGSDCISREVGNYEGQIMAIRLGYVDRAAYGWEISEKGWQALRDAGHPEQHILPAIDSWHGSRFQYRAQEITYRSEPALKIFAKCYPYADRVGMDPLLNRNDVTALRDYLSDWLTRHP